MQTYMYHAMIDRVCISLNLNIIWVTLDTHKRTGVEIKPFHICLVPLSMDIIEKYK